MCSEVSSMIGAISGAYNSVYFPRAISQTSPVWAARRVSNPEAAVEPVTPVRPSPEVNSGQGRLFRQELPTLRQGVDPVEWAVRMRIQSAQQEESAPQLSEWMGQAEGLTGQNTLAGTALAGADTQAALSGQVNGNAVTLSGQTNENAAVLPGQTNEDAVTLPGLPGEGAALPSVDAEAALGAGDVQKAVEEGKCETCEKRKYQDGSDDPGVSFKTPTNVSPEMAASAVRGHEQEHVVREQAKAQREDRRVVSQTVTYHTEICPECGKVYVAGGTTRTVTAANPEQEQPEPQEENNQPYAPFAAVM